MISPITKPRNKEESNKPQELVGDDIENKFNSFYGPASMIFVVRMIALMGIFDGLCELKHNDEANLPPHDKQ